MTTVDKHAPGTPGWFDLMTRDPAGARTFYAALFGWDYDISGPEFAHYAMAKLDGRMAAGVGGQPPGASFPSAWNVYFIVDDLDATVARMRDAGGTVMVGPMPVGAQGRLAMGTDATGAAVGCWEPGNHGGAQVRGEPGAMTWCEVNTRDAAAATRFYQAVFGLEPHALDAPGMTYFTLHPPGAPAPVGGVLQMDAAWPATVPPHWMPYFETADPDATCARVSELGGKVCVPPFDSPYGRIAVVEDPQGATFSIVKSAPM